MIELFASDLDGTLLTDHVVDDTVIDAIRAVRQAGRQFSVVTGRSMYPHQRREMGFEPLGIYTICMNGALIFAPDGTELYRRPFDTAFLREMLARFPDLMAEYLSPVCAYVRRSERAYTDWVQRADGVRAQRWLPSFLRAAAFSVSDDALLGGEIVKINARTEDPAARAALEAFLAENRRYVRNTPFQEDLPDHFELTAAGVDKAEAVAWLLGHLGLREDAVAVYGDGPNDSEMLRRFPHSFAPANASPRAKAAAHAHIGDCADHAVPLHMRALLAEDG